MITSITSYQIHIQNSKNWIKTSRNPLSSTAETQSAPFLRTLQFHTCCHLSSKPDLPPLSLLPHRSPSSVPKLLFRRQPRLPGGQGRAAAQLCPDWTIYRLVDSSGPAEHHPPDRHPLLQWPFREQARVQDELSRWGWVFDIRASVLVCVSSLMIGSNKGHKPWGDTAGTSSSKMSPAGTLRKETLVYSFRWLAWGNTRWLLE